MLHLSSVKLFWRLCQEYFNHISYAARSTVCFTRPFYMMLPCTYSNKSMKYGYLHLTSDSQHWSPREEMSKVGLFVSSKKSKVQMFHLTQNKRSLFHRASTHVRNFAVCKYAKSVKWNRNIFTYGKYIMTHTHQGKHTCVTWSLVCEQKIRAEESGHFTLC